MYNEHFGFQVSPFSATPDPQVFFSNSLYQEAFATLQYGVLAKKGFVLITGEVGTGKTTLLRKLLHSLGPTVHSVFIFNTQVNFVDLLRLILDDLNLSRQNDDKLHMIEVLNQYLIERLRQGHIVTVLIDEAQNLCDEALEGLRLLSNLETDTEKLLQIVLMGQPELETKLDQPKLRQLKQRITLQCRLAPLRGEEVGAYIDFRLKAAGYRGKNLFDHTSLEAIAFYSRGIPRLVNIISDNALLAAFARSKKEISSEMIKEVTADLRLAPPEMDQSVTQSAHSPWTQRPEPSSWLGETDPLTTDDIWISRSGRESFTAAPVMERRFSRNRQGAGVIAGTLIGLVTLSGMGVTLYSRQIAKYLMHSLSDIEGPAERSVSTAASPPVNPFPRQPEATSPQLDGKPTPKDVPASEPPPVTTEPGEVREPPPNKEETVDQSKVVIPASPKVVVPPSPKAPSRIDVRKDSQVEKRRIEAEIYKAIQNRAIQGVSVSVIDGVAYLDGRVASIRQKLMAERAARTVTEVKQVRNRLTVGPY